ncbi:putative metallopeptidase [Clostridium sp. 'White wine YQ']|uniref:putative metallopeptidase n=1 Tax=Clostridium sp. 'White wine YQ' TaxID=3027474 RepID=UPI002367363B|nr:putative metallopeptidase [Clostridium sp. 'White wine YQ']MDD7793673.1 putative metallopeptidase [Clostridium sp. 'White wine YQ']
MHIKIQNEVTGEVQEINCVGFNLQYVEGTGNGKIQKIRALNNGKYGLKYWIKNDFYYPKAKKIKEAFKEKVPGFININVEKILFIEDQDYVGDEINKDKDWVMKIKKVPVQVEELTGYKFIIESREFWISRISNEQIIAHLYSVLRQIDCDKIVEPDVKQWKEVLGALGLGWGTTITPIPNLLEEIALDDDDFKMLKKADRQMRIDMRQAK